MAPSGANEYSTPATPCSAPRTYRAVTVDRLSDAAGITTPVFYDHFASKRALYQELLVAHAQRLVAATTIVSERRHARRDTARECRRVFAFVEAHPGAWRMLFRDAPDEPGIEALHVQIQTAATARLAETIVARADGVRLSVEPPADQASLRLAELGKSALNSLAGWCGRTARSTARPSPPSPTTSCGTASRGSPATFLTRRHDGPMCEVDVFVADCRPCPGWPGDHLPRPTMSPHRSRQREDARASG